MINTPEYDESSAVPRRSGWRFWRALLLLFLWSWVVLLVAVGVAGISAYMVYDHVTRSGMKGEAVVVEVPPGTTGRDVGRLLADQGLVEHEGFFRLALQLNKDARPIRHGAYELYRGLSPMDLLRLLQEGPSPHLEANQFRITIPEGLSIPQVAALCDQPEGVIQAAGNPGLIQGLGITAPSLEGFLMPNTYFFDKPPEPLALLTRMTGQFAKEWEALIKEYPGAAEQDKLELVTIASLVERETKVDEERPFVARVIYNRIRKEMPLQLDSTLQYALNKYGQRMLNEDREAQSPYNTYKYRGLPPGPICSPGLKSLRAALAPAEANYLYFVSNADGATHTFSSTLEEHNRAVARFRREIEPQRRALRGQQ